MAWDRLLWAVETDSPPYIIGQAWNGIKPGDYDGEPTRALVFCTRDQARKWCRNANAKYKHLGWKFVPIRVRETVEKVT